MLHARIGKVFFLLLCCVRTYAEHIQLRIVSEQGRPIQRITAGSPCMVEVIIPGSVTLQKRPAIAGITQSQIIREQESMQMYIKNGITMQERIIGYLVSFPEVGTVHIGPARVETSQGELVSPTVTLEVQEVAVQQTAQVRAELHLEKTSAYISEAVPYTIRFYYSNDAVSQVALRPFSLSDCKMVQSDTVRKGTTEQQGERYAYLEWSGVLYPQRAGRITIPRIYFDYTESASRALQQQWAQFMHMMSGFFSQKQLSTEPMVLHVQQLPPSTQQVVGVGSITDVALTCSSKTIMQGESLTCHVRIDGAFDGDALQLPSLQVPETVRVYQSQTKKSGAYPENTITYEYIVQALEQGTIEIPAQRYCFFDPKSERYMVFTTPPHMIYVTPAVHAAEAPVEIIEKPQPQEAQQPLSVPVVSEQALDVAVKLPLHWFFVLLLLPVVWVSIRKYLFLWYAAVRRQRERTRIIRLMRRDLQSAVEHNNPYAFLKSWNMFEQMLDPTVYLTDDELKSWYVLVDKMSEAAFFASDKQHLQELLHRSENILNIIEVRVRRMRRIRKDAV